MGTKLQPGQFDCYANAEPDEPMFILLARDPAAPLAIEDWADIRSKMIWHGQKPASDWPMIQEARECAQRMRDWRRQQRPFVQAEYPVAVDSGSSLRDLLKRAAKVVRKEFRGLLNSYRAPGQTDEQVIADDENEGWVQKDLIGMRDLLAEIDVALKPVATEEKVDG